MTDKQFYTVQGWMLNELELRGNELLVYAIIWGFSQDGESIFRGSLTYLQNATGATRHTIIDILKRLEAKGLLRKIETSANGVKRFEYMALVPKKKDEAEVQGGGANDEEKGPEVVQKLHHGSAEIAPNNIRDNINIYTPEDNKLSSPPNEGDGAQWHTPEFIEMWNLLCRQPRWKKKSLDALKASFKKLNERPEDIAVQMMRNSIANGWQGVFDLKPYEITALRQKARETVHSEERKLTFSELEAIEKQGLKI